ncbi:MAG: urease accessory protein UreE [Chthoniobacterales bacterium]
MQLIRDHIHSHGDLPVIPLPVDRLTLAKRRWRGKAADGTEFGFDLEHHLHDGDTFHQEGIHIYRIQQTPEPVLSVVLDPDSTAAARLGWMIGNLHFQLGLAPNAVLVPDDPALRQLFEREHIAYQADHRVFHPLSGGHHH